ncbi:MAG: hypothetical protein ACWA5R_02105 [bacterium]
MGSFSSCTYRLFSTHRISRSLRFFAWYFYLIRLGYRVYALRAQRYHFQQQLGFLSLLSVTGLLIAALGISLT